MDDKNIEKIQELYNEGADFANEVLNKHFNGNRSHGEVLMKLSFLDSIKQDLMEQSKISPLEVEHMREFIELIEADDENE